MLNRHSVWTKTALLFVFLTLSGRARDEPELLRVSGQRRQRRARWGHSGRDGHADQHRDERAPRGRERGRWRPYRFLNLVPGTYRLEVELTGFQRFVRDGIAVNVQSAPRIEVTLQLGSLSETVLVSGEAPVLQTENASIGIVMESSRIRQLSLNGGNVLNLITLAPSVVPQGGSEGSLTGKNVFAAGNYQIGGGTANQSASYFDGVHGAGFGLRQHRRADAEPGGGRRVPRADQQQQRRVRPLHRRRRQHRLALGHQHLPGQHLRTTPQQGAQLEHVLRRARRPRQAAVRAEQLRRVDGRSGAQEQAVLLRQLRRLPQPRGRAVPPHGADGRDEER